MMASSDPYAELPDRKTLTDDAGTVVLVFSRSESGRGATPWADAAWCPSRDLVDAAARLVLHALTGWLFSTSNPDLVAGLLRRGATERRHAHTMTHQLGRCPTSRSAARRIPASSRVLRVEPLTSAQAHRHAFRLGAVHLRAYPPGHPDAFEGTEADAVSYIGSVARGELLGPLMTQSRVALMPDHIVGACLVVDRPGAPPHGGPWIIDLFRDPDCTGRQVGTALLESSVAAACAAALPGLSLAVSHDNERARRLYLRTGFVAADESWTLALP